MRSLSYQKYKDDFLSTFLINQGPKITPLEVYQKTDAFVSMLNSILDETLN